VVEIRPETLLEALAKPAAGDAPWLRALEESRVASDARRPTVEAALHAILAVEFGARFVLHTHPTAVLSILCSPLARAFAEQRRYPDEVVLTGVASCVVPYIDPGRELAIAVRAEVCRFVEKHGSPPAVILMENHGMIAVGSSWLAALEATLMTVKAARITMAAAVLGGVRPLSATAVGRIDGREDEQYRRSLLR